MKAIQLKAYGNPIENLVFTEISDPENLEDHEVIIDVYYSPVNPTDLQLANGIYPVSIQLPAVIGGEGVGKVSKIGRSVTNVKIGDVVNIPFGTFTWSEKVKAEAGELSILPQGINLKQASMTSVNATAAVLLLDKFPNLKQGDWIIVNAANSSVARAIIAVAKIRGIKILGIVRSEIAKATAVIAGADVVLIENPNVEEEAAAATNGFSIKVALDAVSGKATNLLVRLLGEDSDLITYAFMSGENMDLSPGIVTFKRITVRGFFMLSPENIPKLRAAAEKAVELVSKGIIAFPIAKIYKPEEIKEAVQHTIDGGKVLLEFQT
ncbi:MAG: alcohol dehydrogenase [Mucilaginibacter sp.]|nr:alcohol dehydrogenase [Mucilaginibacter sp.]